jgi:hypothetical protein
MTGGRIVIEGKVGELNAGTVYCVRCGYPLVGVRAEETCPECGASVAEAISAKEFFARDEARTRWTGVGLILLLVAIGGEVAWGVLFGGLVIGLQSRLSHTPTEGWLKALMVFNALVLVILPAMSVLGAYFLFYGITRVNKGGKAVAARLGLMAVFAVYLVSAGFAWGAMVSARSGDLEFYVVAEPMSVLARYPLVLGVGMSLAMGLTVAAVAGANERISREINRLWLRLAYGAVVVVFLLGVASHGVGMLEASVYGPNRGAGMILPEWTVLRFGQSGMSGYYIDTVRFENLGRVNRSDVGDGTILRWTNVAAWWGRNTWGQSIGIRGSGGPAWRQEMLDTLSCGLGEASVVGQRSVHHWVPHLLFWPELVWLAAGLLASGYLSVFVLVTGWRAYRILPKSG